MELTTEAVANHNGVSVNTVSRWARARLVRPDGGYCQRVPWRWSPTTFREASLVAALSSARLRWETIGGLMEHLRGLPPQILANAQAVLVHRRDGAAERLVELLDQRQLRDVAAHLAFGDILVALPKLPDES